MEMPVNQREDRETRNVVETLRGSLTMLAFGLGVLAFLIGIDRPEWFNLRPASGAAAAMSKASDAFDRQADTHAIKEGRP
jgi:hypothetical protein